MDDNKAIMIIICTFLIMAFGGLTLNSYFESKKPNREKAFDCIERSEKTDADICNCLWKYDIKDTTLCNGK